MMREKPVCDGSGGSDFQEFLISVEVTLLVDLSVSQASRCETIGEFENYVYDQMALRPLTSEQMDRVIENTLDSINRGLHLYQPGDCVTDGVTKNDFESKVSDLVRTRWRSSWDTKYQSIRWELGESIPRLKFVGWAKVFLWIYAAAVIGLIIWASVVGGWCAGGSAVGMGLLLLAFFMSKLPRRVDGEEKTFGEAMDLYVGSVEQIRTKLSFPEVQLRIRKAYAHWNGGIDPDQISSEAQMMF